MKNYYCLTCKSELDLDNEVTTGEIIECESCGQEHEIQVTDGEITVGLAPEIEETWGE